jgi:hypothetical protein
MKKILLLFVSLGLVAGVAAQTHPAAYKEKSNVKVLRHPVAVDGNFVGTQPANTTTASKAVLDDPSVNTTKYDFQSNGASLPRLYKFADGTMGTTGTMAQLDDFTDRGTGYNYNDGSGFGPQPSDRIESVRTGWPSYAPLGANGEIVISHVSATGPLMIDRRDTKGTGTWIETSLPPPADAGTTGMIWAKMVTNGPNREYVHIISLTGPAANGGAAYQGLDGAILYTRSLDGGETFEDWRILPGMTSDDYLAFSADAYAWAEPKGNTIAFVTGDNWYDEFMMKSTDNGETWTKTKIWSCLYNKYVNGPNDTTPMFYCPDGSSGVTLDNSGKAHVVFGLQRAKGDADGKKWYPFTDGVIYWNEDMAELPQSLDPDTLYNHGQYIGWVTDTNVYYAQQTELAHYYNSMTGWTTIISDQWDNLFVNWSGVTVLRDPNSYMLRHIFSRASTTNGATWRDTIVDLTGDFLYTWSECVYPSVSATSDDKEYVLFQADADAGAYIQSVGVSGYQGQTNITVNDMILVSPTKESIIVPATGIESKSANSFTVMQNSPNPVKGMTYINVNLTKPGNVRLDVYSPVGQKITTLEKANAASGNLQFAFDGSNLAAGVYFYTITANNSSVTKKMIVE